MLGKTGDIHIGTPTFALDALIIAIISVLICFFSQDLILMTVLVPILMVSRCIVWVLMKADNTRKSITGEFILLTICIALGAFNDWNSVDNHRIYDYTVPHFFPTLSTIPFWMLLYWGMILRALVSLFRWHPLGTESKANNKTKLFNFCSESPLLKISLQLAIIVITRQFIYRYFEDPILSWIPFAVAIIFYCLVFDLKKSDYYLAIGFLIFGPIIEILYIQVGHLHQYHLGVLGGIPIWLALWWVLSMLIWKDLSIRLWKQIETLLLRENYIAK